MAEPSKCPYCHTGTPTWILNGSTHILHCTYCEASGSYEAAQQSVVRTAVAYSAAFFAVGFLLAMFIFTR